MSISFAARKVASIFDGWNHIKTCQPAWLVRPITWTGWNTAKLPDTGELITNDPPMMRIVPDNVN